MATYSYIIASDNYLDGSANGDANNNFFATSGSTIRLQTPRTITSENADGLIGEICYDFNYIYVCVATNTWKRSSLFTW